jgi:hypothetical protein
MKNTICSVGAVQKRASKGPTRSPKNRQIDKILKKCGGGKLFIYLNVPLPSLLTFFSSPKYLNKKSLF